MSGLTRHIIVIRPLLLNVIQIDMSLSVPPKWQRFSVVMQTLQWLSVSSNHLDFLVIKTLQWLSMSSNHLQSAAIKYAFTPCLASPTLAMSLYKYISSCNASSHFTHTLSLHPHINLLNMSRYLIPTWNECPFCHYGADHIWKEMLGVSWDYCEWRCKHLYLDSINWWLQWQY
jgi:hypothetical protein